MLQDALQDFITLWVVIDPIGSVPIFLAVTAGMTASMKRMVAIRAVLVTLVVLLAFMAGGQIVLEALGIGLPSFQIAGGIVLFLFALTMIFGIPKSESELSALDTAARVAVFPVAIPSLASPGAMLAAVVLTDNNRFSLLEQAVTALAMVGVLAITLALLLAAGPIHRVIGKTGEMIISRVMGMVLAAVAVEAVIEGFAGLGLV